ncbi:3-oxoadipate enol-lactonase [Palleronia aestuarii]|uniref:3-oxoadipate enol-lactonase n=1 Tax=Palleronia aestuarii TaxID=568105 RepID=A0A2W7QD12_9RHOB|nr:3-oxoadipate enol-lactonase [Palleronia aestuarii]PZX19739.1 3-oxoadipate enol-lactonase [Palleronia aestuarii]
MPIADLGGLHVHYRDEGDPDGPAIVLSHALGTDLRVWDAVVPLLPVGLRCLRYDLRGHGLSDCPPAPYAMGALVTDAERLLDRLEVRECVFVGLSIGGMIAQALAVKRLDLVRALVLSNTAAKIGTTESWQDRIDLARAEGLAALSGTMMERWFSASFRATPDLAQWANLFERTPLEGYAGCAAAISGTDLMAATARLTLPTLVLAGSADGSTPPDLVRETAALIAGSDFHLIRGAGHLPCVEAPQDVADVIGDFVRRIGHSTTAGDGRGAP